MTRIELTNVRRAIQQAPPLPLVVGTLSELQQLLATVTIEELGD